MKNKYWMVKVEGEPDLSYEHQSYDEAMTEAKRLARLLGKRVYVLEAVHCVEYEQFKISNLHEYNKDDDLPF